jgi:hypothetical protein
MALSITPSGHFRGNDGPWSTFNVWVGDSPDPFEVLPASSLSLTLVVLGEGCPLNAPTDCDTLRGNLFDTRDSSTWTNVTAADGSPVVYVTLQTEQEFLPEQVAAEMGVDLLRLWRVNNSTENRMPLGNQLIAAYATKYPFLGLLGLSGFPISPVTTTISYNSTLQALKNYTTVSGLTWAYTAGANYTTPQHYGSLTFGGYDSSRINMDEALTGVNFTNSPLGKGDELTLTTKTITVGDTTTSIGLFTLLDSMLPDIWLPEDVCKIFEDKFHLQWNNTWNMYLVSQEQRAQLIDENTSVSFELASESNLEKTATITLPYRAFDREVKYPLVNITDDTTTMYYFPLKSMASKSNKYGGVLGRTFFQEA